MMRFFKYKVNLKSKKGITMMSLLVYVAAFLMVSGIIAAVTTFFFSNYSYLDGNVSISSEYNKLNLSFLEETKKNGIYIYSFKASGDTIAHNFGTTENNIEYASQYELLEDVSSKCEEFFNTYILFSDENFIGFRADEKAIYYNQSVLCEDVEKLTIDTDYKNGKEVINVFVQFEKKSFSTKYTIN